MTACLPDCIKTDGHAHDCPNAPKPAPAKLATVEAERDALLRWKENREQSESEMKATAKENR